MLHVSSSSQTQVVKLGLGPGEGGRNFDERLGGVLRVDLSMRTRVSLNLRFRSF